MDVRRDRPVRRIRPSQLVSIFTGDCFGGRLRSTSDRRSAFRDDQANPQTGPFHVVGAEPGDTLAIHLIDVEPARDWAVSSTVPLFGALTGTRTTATLQPPLPELTWIYAVDLTAREVVFQARDSSHTSRLPMTPFLGTIGVAPAGGEVRSSLVPDAFGENMDAPECQAGTTLYLGVNVPGALLSLGDGHCCQGDGEACGVAVESAMNTPFTVTLIKGYRCEWPRLETDSEIMVAGSSRPLEDAFRVAHVELVRWIAAASGLSELDAYQLVAQGARSRIANVCDPNYTVVAKIVKALIPGQQTWMGDAHRNLRRIGVTAMLAGPTRDL